MMLTLSKWSHALSAQGRTQMPFILQHNFKWCNNKLGKPQPRLDGVGFCPHSSFVMTSDETPQLPHRTTQAAALGGGGAGGKACLCIKHCACHDRAGDVGLYPLHHICMSTDVNTPTLQTSYVFGYIPSTLPGRRWLAAVLRLLVLWPPMVLVLLGSIAASP